MEQVHNIRILYQITNVQIHVNMNITIWVNLVKKFVLSMVVIIHKCIFQLKDINALTNVKMNKFILNKLQNGSVLTQVNAKMLKAIVKEWIV